MQNGAERSSSSSESSSSLVDTHATVTLPITHRRLPPRPPGGAVRRLPPIPSREAPVPPPRPESTLSSRSIAVVAAPPPPRVPPPVSTVISLNAPRPGVQRAQNLYVDAPLTTPPSPPPQPTTSEFKLSKNNNNNTVITSSKTSSPLSESDTSSVETPESIICRDCGKCRCQACRAPRKLPQRWICNDKWLCSPQTTIEVLSCYCCIRGTFYHCRKDSLNQDSSEVDKPCSCSNQDSACLRWTCLSALSLVMPCLWCYLPMKGCVKASEIIYGKCTATGCTCSQQQPIHNNNNNKIIDSEKRLLG